MREKLRQKLGDAIQELLALAGESGSPPDFALDVSRRNEHGDYACNAPLLMAKLLKRPPREIAAQLIERLGDASGLVERAVVAGPGFVNIWLAGGRWQDVLRQILAAAERYGRSDVGKGQTVQVEFVSANPTGPLSTGHGRQAVLGDTIARLLEFCGYEVTREYYFNDGGRQMRVLGESIRARYLEDLGLAAPPSAEALANPKDCWQDRRGDLPVVFPVDGYQGDYIAGIAAGLRAEHGEALVDEPGDGRFREVAEAAIFADIRRTLDTLGVHFDVYFPEKSLYDDGKLDEVLNELRGKGNIYESEGAVWLRSTEMGFSRDRVLIKSSGEPTYLLPDIAYHRDKLQRGFDLVVDVLGADHIEQFPFVQAGTAALGFDSDRIELVMHQFVTLTRSGEKVKQSTRRATFVTVDELIEDIGVDVFRFFMIERRADGHLDFDLDRAEDRNWRKNPAYSIQYAHARSCGIERKAAELGIETPDPYGFDAAMIALPEELEIVKKLGEFPELVARAMDTREPHHLAYYLRDVAGLWNSYLQDGTKHRVIGDDPALSAARLALVGGVRTVLASGLRLLGLSVPEQM